MHNLAQIYHALGCITNALEWYEKTVDIGKASLGAEHSHTFTSVRHFANFLREIGRGNEAMNLITGLVQLYTSKYGSDNFTALQLMSDFAICKHDLGYQSDAL